MTQLPRQQRKVIEQTIKSPAGLGRRDQPARRIDKPIRRKRLAFGQSPIGLSLPPPGPTRLPDREPSGSVQRTVRFKRLNHCLILALRYRCLWTARR